MSNKEFTELKALLTGTVLLLSPLIINAIENIEERRKDKEKNNQLSRLENPFPPIE